MNVMWSQITDHWTIRFRACGPTSKKHQSPHYRPFLRGIHQWPVTKEQWHGKNPFHNTIMMTHDVMIWTHFPSYLPPSRLVPVETTLIIRHCQEPMLNAIPPILFKRQTIFQSRNLKSSCKLGAENRTLWLPFHEMMQYLDGREV